MDYLSEDEIKRAQMCVLNIQDKLDSVVSEIKRERPHKNYLKEKLDSITWDINVLNSMIKNNEDEE